MNRNYTNLLASVVMAVTVVAANAAQAQLFANPVTGSDRPESVRGQSLYEELTFQEPVRGESIFERKRPDYEPVGIKKGGFIISPGVAFSVESDSNIFATDTSAGDEESDLVAVVNPGLRVDSDWGRHSLSFRSALRAGTYLENEKQDFTDGIVALNGVYDIARGFNVRAGSSAQHLHEERGTPNATIGNLDGPTEYFLTVSNLGVHRDMGLISLDLEGNYLRWDYDNNIAVNNNDRDRSDVVGIARVGYEFIRGYEIFLRLTGNKRMYDDRIDDAGFARTSDGIEGVVGASFDVTDLITGEAYAGWTQQDYRDVRFNQVEAGVFGTSFLWNVTPLTSLRGTVDRSIRDSVTPLLSSFIDTAYRVTVEHELRRNLLLGAYSEFRNYDFQGIDTNRQDQLTEVGFGGRYLVGRNVVVGADYAYRTRASNADNTDYNENIVVGTIGFRF